MLANQVNSVYCNVCMVDCGNSDLGWVVGVAAYCQVKLLTKHCMSTRTYKSILMSRPMCYNTVNSVSVLMSVLLSVLSVLSVLLSVCLDCAKTLPSSCPLPAVNRIECTEPS